MIELTVQFTEAEHLTVMQAGVARRMPVAEFVQRAAIAEAKAHLRYAKVRPRRVAGPEPRRMYVYEGKMYTKAEFDRLTRRK